MPGFLEKISEYRDIIPDFDEYLDHLSRPLPVYFRINTIKISIEEAKSFLAGEKIEFQETAIQGLLRVTSPLPCPLLSYHLGYIYPQALSSSLPVMALAPEPDQLVLDMCAAPGGKATHIAQIMNDTGLVVANDRRHKRLMSLMANVKRLGITNTLIIRSRGEHLNLPYRFDRVLVDAPCSGEGKYRIDAGGGIRHMRFGRTDLPAIQKALILRGYDMLKPGGILVYSSCTLNVHENEGVVNYLLSKRNADLMDFRPPVPFSPGITRFREHGYDQRLGMARRFYPHKLDSVGFFVAGIVKG